MSSLEASQGFSTFIRQYASTSIHGVTGTLLTLFGLLSFVSRWFIAVAIAVYVLPPIYLYLTADEGEPGDAINEPATEAEAEPEDEPHSGPAEATAGDEGRADEVVTAAGEPDRPTGSADRADASAPGGAEGSSPAEPAAGATAATAERSDAGAGADAGDTSGESAAGTAVGGGDAADQEGKRERKREWTENDSPTEEGLTDAVVTANGPYAVGTGGVVLTRDNEDGSGGEWAVGLERGPTTEGNDLRGADASEEGRHLWVAGDSGVLGRYDTGDERLTDYSAPLDITNNWTDVAVVGPAGGETVFLVDGSGQVLRGEFDDGEPTWDDPVTPGSGSSMSSVEFIEAGGYLCDTNAGVYETADGGESYEVIGIEDAGAEFTDIAPASQESVHVICDDGTVFRYDGTTWTKLYAGEQPLRAIDRRDDRGVAVGDEGAIYEHAGGDWEPASSPVEAALYGVAVDPDGEAGAIAVGGDGTIVEHR